MNSKRVLLSVGTLVSFIATTVAIKLVHSKPMPTRTDLPQTSTNQVLPAKEKPKGQQMIEPRRVLNTAGGQHATQQSDYKLIWQQDFARQPNGLVDPQYWNVASSNLPIYNSEKQVYMAQDGNVRIQDGRLVLEAHSTPAGYSSGRVDTRGKVKIEVGSRLEARIKLPTGQGTWPAFWLMSANQPHTAKLHPTELDWQSERFYMWDGEIDIMEAYGTHPGTVEATVHTFKKSQEQQQQHISNDFHTYWLEWQEDKLVFGVDSTSYGTYKRSGGPDVWPFTQDNQFYIILNLAMGGSGGGQIIQKPGDLWRMEIEHIRYYRL